MLEQQLRRIGLGPRLGFGLSHRGLERRDRVADWLVHEMVGLVETGFSRRLERLRVLPEQHAPAIRQPLEIDVGDNRVVELHGRAFVDHDPAPGVGELLQVFRDRVRQCVRLAHDDQRLEILDGPVGQRPFVNNLSRITGSREGVVRGEHRLLVVAADVVGVDVDLFALERGVLRQRGDQQLDLIARFLAGLFERDVFLAHRQFREAPQHRDVVAGEQRLLQYGSDLLCGVVDFGEIGRLHDTGVEPPIAGQSGGEHAVQAGSIGVGLLRRRDRIAEELPVHRVSHARARVMRLFKLHAGVRSQPVDAPIDKDV